MRKAPITDDIDAKAPQGHRYASFLFRFGSDVQGGAIGGVERDRLAPAITNRLSARDPSSQLGRISVPGT
jgi:hypothetical protein